MEKHLVIVESPAKARTINKILGNSYFVKASLGHVRDLPERKLGVDIENGFAPEYVDSKGKKKIIMELKKAAKDCSAVYLAPDPDREGEAIAWHLFQALKEVISPENFHRVAYNQITAPAIRKAFEDPGPINQNKVDAQQARRIIDRLVGYKVSPLLWRRIKGGSSAGRVQTVALRLVCERERLIEKFVPEKYWIFGARVAKKVDPKDPFEIRLLKIDGEKAEVKKPELAEKIRKDLESRTLEVAGITSKEIVKKAPPPFITSTLQQAASSYLGYSPKRTMSLAQKLYEGADTGTGLITYMRTDSFHFAPEAIQSCRAYIKESIGDKYLPEKPLYYKSKGSAQEAHEAIRPVDFSQTPLTLKSILSSDELKVYELIWRRALASQIAPARIEQLLVDISAVTSEPRAVDYLFRGSASKIVFPGFMKVLKMKNEEDQTKTLPPLSEKEKLDCLEWLSEEKETQPPQRYSEASLIREMEENGVGRPSTYASIISTILDRDYIERKNRSLKPTEIGYKVNDYLIEKLDTLFDVKFTAKMEEQLDKIEEGKIAWVGMLENFYKDFSEWVLNAKGAPADKNVVKEIITLLDEVKTWNPPFKRGKRTYNDQKLYSDIKDKLDDEQQSFSEAQLNALKWILCRYKEQINSFKDEIVERMKLQEILQTVNQTKLPPKQETLEKIEILKTITFNEPQKIGKKVLDDEKFFKSLSQHVNSGSRLSEKQELYLNQLLEKYNEQIPDFEILEKKLGLVRKETDQECKALLQLMKSVTEWRPPVKRGKRSWNDKEFISSLDVQFLQKKMLSPRQKGALRKMVIQYASKIPTYAEAMKKLDLPDPPEPK